MAKSVRREVERNGESWAEKSRPAKVEREFPRGRGQADDHPIHGGFLQQRKGGEK
jgi:hypothetical protein